jgi:5-methylcytosine-specific restriction protein A
MSSYLVERVEFDQRTKDKAWFRAEGKCRECKVKIAPGGEEYDHILPTALGGKATLANCQVLCRACHGVKTAKEDIPRIRKSDRQRRYHNGTKAAPTKKIDTAPMPKAEPQRRATGPLAKPSLPPRAMYRSE